MTLEIHAPQADTLAQALATATGEDIDTTVIRATEERLARIPRRQPAGPDAAIDALWDQLIQMPLLDARSPDEIIGFTAKAEMSETPIAAVGEKQAPEPNLAEAIRRRFEPFGRVDDLEQHPPVTAGETTVFDSQETGPSALA